MQSHLLAFEGPDDDARDGGIATRIMGLARALAETGYDTHLRCIADPDLPGHEQHDQLRLHRWCQWISRTHPADVARHPDSHPFHFDFVHWGWRYSPSSLTRQAGGLRWRRPPRVVLVNEAALKSCLQRRDYEYR